MHIKLKTITINIEKHMPNIHDVYLSNKVRLYYTDYDIILLLLDSKHMTVTECLTC